MVHKSSAAEELLALHLKADKIAFEREAQIIPNRAFRFDFRCYGFRVKPTVVMAAKEVLVEVNGGVWLKGKSGHSSGVGITRDCEKLSLAAVHGYRTIVCTPEQVKSGKAVAWIKAALQ